MRKKIVLGLTGGIASGKSSVLLEFKRLGAQTLDCDEIAREVVQPGKKAYHKIVQYFGKEVVQANGRLHRKKIAKIVFANPAKRKELEKIVHPEVIRELKKRIARIQSGLIVIDIPLLFEAHLTKMVDKIAVVWLPLQKQIQRLCQRDGLARKDALLRIRSQLSLNRKKSLADEIIDNSSTKDSLRAQVVSLYKKLTEPS